MPNDRRFDPHAPRRDFGRFHASDDSQWDDPQWTGEGDSEQYYGTGSHYGGGFGTAPSSRASAAGASGSSGYARQGSWSDESDWLLEDESRESQRGRGPKGYTRTDERLRETICERLMDDPRIDASEIEVDVQQQKVTLLGTVTDRRTKYAVEDLVENCGVSEIENLLRVTRSW